MRDCCKASYSFNINDNILFPYISSLLDSLNLCFKYCDDEKLVLFMRVNMTSNCKLCNEYCLVKVALNVLQRLKFA